MLDTKVFEDIDSSSLEFRSISKSSKQGYIINFYGHKISNTTKAFSVRAMKYWANVTHSPAALVKYVGPPKILVNTEKNCVIWVTDLSPESMSLECETWNYRPRDLDDWRTLRMGNPFEDIIPTAVIEDLPKVRIYCLGRAISIEGVTFDCPPYAFALPAYLKWNTSDRIFPGYARSVMNMEVKILLPINIDPADIQMPNSSVFA